MSAAFGASRSSRSRSATGQHEPSTPAALKIVEEREDDASRPVAVSGSEDLGAAGAGEDGSEEVVSALIERLGAERFAVWFGDSVRLRTIGCGVVVESGDGFVLDWLKKTFRGDLEAVARSIRGPEAGVVFRCDAATAAASPETEIAKSGVPAPAKAAPVKSVAPSPAVPAAAERVVPASTEARGAARRPRFSRFIVGESNRMAHAAVELAVQRPGEVSPLVIQGPSGVGKTHLLEQACARARELQPGITALFLSAEQFTTSFLQALHGGGLPAFRRNCRNVDLLAIDDLQFFIGKRATSVEVQQTLDALQRQGKQLFVSCDRDISDLGDLGADLVQRLQGGMSARIGPPDAEVRRGIVLALAERKQLGLAPDVIDYVITHMTRTARELAGAVNRLEATSHMLGVPITRGLAEEALSDLVRASVRSVRLADIERAVCSAFGLPAGTLQTSRRTKTVNHPRMLAMFLARKHTPAALTEIGSYFGRRSHSTVIAAHKTVSSWVSSRSQLQIADARWDADEAVRRVEDLLRTG